MYLSDTRVTIDQFLTKAKSYRRQPGKIYGTVYCICNCFDGKVYVGSTIDITRRAKEYIRAYYNTNFREERLITAAIRKYGIENCKMIKLIDCNSALELAYHELYYLRKFNSLYPNGYNESINVSARVKPDSRTKGSQVVGIKQSADTRRKRALEIVAVNPEIREVVISDSAALFGEIRLNGTPRTQVSNACKSHTRLKNGWYIYYNCDLQFNLQASTTLPDIMIRGSGFMSGRGNYQYREIAYGLLHDSFDFIRVNQYKLYEIRYTDDDQRYILNELKLPDVT